MGERAQMYEREKLYEEVWKEPVLVVANRYGTREVRLPLLHGKGDSR
jgi:hypothetical protein